MVKTFLLFLIGATLGHQLNNNKIKCPDSSNSLLYPSLSASLDVANYNDSILFSCQDLCSNLTNLSFEWLFNLKLADGSILTTHTSSLNEKNKIQEDFSYLIENEFQVLIATCVLKIDSISAVHSFAVLPKRSIDLDHRDQSSSTIDEASTTSTTSTTSMISKSTTTTTTENIKPDVTTTTATTTKTPINSTSTHNIDDSTISLKVSYIAGIAVGSFLFGIILSTLIIILVIRRQCNFQRKGQYKKDEKNNDGNGKNSFRMKPKSKNHYNL